MAAILVVDDYHAMVLTIHHMLRPLGFSNLFEANDGREAWNCLCGRPYRLVISDLNMRSMGGLELLRLVRADEHLKTMPFIMDTVATLEAKLASALGDLAA